MDISSELKISRLFKWRDEKRKKGRKWENKGKRGKDVYNICTLIFGYLIPWSPETISSGELSKSSKLCTIYRN